MRFTTEHGGAAIRATPEAAILDYILVSAFAFAPDQGAARAEAKAALDHWVALGLPVAQDGAGKTFDPVEVANFARWAGVTGRDDLWQTGFVATCRRLVAEFGDAGENLPPRRFRVRLSRRFENLPPGQHRLRLPAPLAADLSARVIAPADARVTIAPGRVEAVADASEITAEFSFTADPTPREPSLTPDEAALYTRESEGVVQVTPAIRALAESMGTPADIPRRFWELFHTTLLCGAVHYEAIPAAAPLDWLLEHRWFDCHLGSALLVALCRAREIPARICSGYALFSVPFYHYWAEVFSPDQGWLPFDLLTWTGAPGDPAWRDHYFGALDDRMQTQCLPRLFTGTSPAKLPPAWITLPRIAEDGGVDLLMLDRATGALVYRDRLRLLTPD